MQYTAGRFMIRNSKYNTSGAAIRQSVCLAFALLFVVMIPLRAAAYSSTNLIIGGDGESGACSDDVDVVTTVPGWTVVKGSPKILCYTAEKYDMPDASSRGKAFLSGGPYGDSALVQSIDISSAWRAIDSGRVGLSFSGWLGGEGDKPGRTSVTLRFVDADGKALGAPLTAASVTAEDRVNVSKFVERKLRGRVPKRTRTIALKLEFLGTKVDPRLSVKDVRAINTGSADNLSLHLSVSVKAAKLTPPPSTVPSFDHVFLIMMENTTYSDLMANMGETPFMKQLMREGAQFTNMVGIDHPSDQNYLAIAGGSAFVKGGTYFPKIRIDAKHIGDSVETAGKSWKGYAQGMGVPCGLTNQYDQYYDADDLPFINFTNIRNNRDRCAEHLVDAERLTVDLRTVDTTPNFVWIAADDYYDGEQAYNQGGLKLSLQTQDQWLEKTITTLFSSPAWKTQRSLLIVTWDESYYPFTQNQIPTFFVASQGLVRAGYHDPISSNLYDIARTIEEALQLPALTPNDRYAHPLNDAFTEQHAN